MAKRTVNQVVDDLTGEDLRGGAGTRVRFGLDGTSYEIDLSPSNAAEMRDRLARYATYARRTSAPAPIDTRAVRAWAASNGVEVSARGRIPADIVEQFRAAGH